MTRLRAPHGTVWIFWKLPLANMCCDEPVEHVHSQHPIKSRSCPPMNHRDKDRRMGKLTRSAPIAKQKREENGKEQNSNARETNDGRIERMKARKQVSFLQDVTHTFPQLQVGPTRRLLPKKVGHPRNSPRPTEGQPNCQRSSFPIGSRATPLSSLPYATHLGC